MKQSQYSGNAPACSTVSDNDTSNHPSPDQSALNEAVSLLSQLSPDAFALAVRLLEALNGKYANQPTEAERVREEQERAAATERKTDFIKVILEAFQKADVPILQTTLCCFAAYDPVIKQMILTIQEASTGEQP